MPPESEATNMFASVMTIAHCLAIAHCLSAACSCPLLVPCMQLLADVFAVQAQECLEEAFETIRKKLAPCDAQSLVHTSFRVTS